MEAGNALSVIYIKNNWDWNDSKDFLNKLEDYAEIHEINDAQDLIGINIGYGKKYWGELKAN